jgi:hypothetical protein
MGREPKKPLSRIPSRTPKELAECRLAVLRRVMREHMDDAFDGGRHRAGPGDGDRGDVRDGRR